MKQVLPRSSCRQYHCRTELRPSLYSFGKGTVPYGSQSCLGMPHTVARTLSARPGDEDWLTVPVYPWSQAHTRKHHNLGHCWAHGSGNLLREPRSEWKTGVQAQLQWLFSSSFVPAGKEQGLVCPACCQ